MLCQMPTSPQIRHRPHTTTSKLRLRWSTGRRPRSHELGALPSCCSADDHAFSAAEQAAFRWKVLQVGATCFLRPVAHAQWTRPVERRLEKQLKRPVQKGLRRLWRVGAPRVQSPPLAHHDSRGGCETQAKLDLLQLQLQFPPPPPQKDLNAMPFLRRRLKPVSSLHE